MAKNIYAGTKTEKNLMAAFENTLKKYPSKLDPNVILKVYEGHFATVHSHITKYFDFSTIKARRSEAMAAANILADKYVNTTIVDTILCMEGTEVIGAYLADKLTRKEIDKLTDVVKLNGDVKYLESLKMIKEPESYEELIRYKRCVDLTSHYSISMQE